MAALCNKCHRTDISVWDTHRIVEQKRGFRGQLIKLVRYYCNECLGYGPNQNTIDYEKESKL